MRATICSSAWPVFESYTLTANALGEQCILPARDTCVRTTIDLTDPGIAREALDGAMQLTRRAGRQKDYLTAAERKAMTSEQLREHRDRLRLLGPVDESAVLDYAAQYGLFGIGPSRLIRSVQHGIRGDEFSVVTYRVAGRLIAFSHRKRMNDEVVHDEPAGVLLSSANLERQEWRENFTAASDLVDAAALYEVGTEEWWRHCADPLPEMSEALFDLNYALETRLEDTYVDLTTEIGRPMIDRRCLKWRSVSAIGALAMMVVQGGLQGWAICEYELCRKPFRRPKKGKRFCTTACRTSKFDRDSRMKRRQESESS